MKVTEAMKTLAVMWKELPPETKMEYQKSVQEKNNRILYLEKQNLKLTLMFKI